MKEFLKKLIENKKTKANELRQSIKAATTADEVRSLGAQLDDIEAEIRSAQAELDKLGDDTDPAGGAASGTEPGAALVDNPIPQDAQQRGLNPYAVASFNMNQQPEVRTGNALDSLEYRQAFAKYVQTGEWNYEKRADETLVTSDVGKVIPNTVMKEFIKELKHYGNIYKRVRRINVKGGVEYPIEELVPTVSWIAETAKSDTQKAPKTNTSVSFGYHIVEAKIAQSLLSSIVSLDILEKEIAKLLAEAFVKEYDKIIFNGTGKGQPLGILKDTRVPEKNIITFTAEELADWTMFRKKLFAAIPVSYRSEGLFVMTAATWESNIMTLRDNNNKPVAKETFNVAEGKDVCTFNGRETELVEPDILKDFDTAASGEEFAVLFRPKDYVFNDNLPLAFKRYYNEDDNKWINKGIAITDGKLLDPNGVFILRKA